MSKFRLLALDLDGTTLNNESQITKTTDLWIRKALDAGVIVSFATGRGSRNTDAFREQLGLDTPMVFLNGGEVWASPDKLLVRHFIEPDDIRKLHSLTVDAGTRFWGYSTEGVISPENFREEMFEVKWAKFGMIHRDLEKIQELIEILKGWGTLEVTQSAPTNIEIGVKGVTKATGIAQVCEHFGLSMNQVMAIGDSINDLELIEAAGLGIAMGNADQRVKTVADTITETNENHGVAEAIRRYIFDL